ncbi:NUDIX domain-containing protein [Paenibacillus sp. LMG 31456]|uniref:NUDIX domain-containing protein n=1 Tax=Paenibacillus foliorum TaxID=2654974 RepID=A0A972K1V7_9BACL|nr:NUDIX domain-containing protein [Paenibacillus foliorum]NOU94283.1 NUDIX domain-containing protein [Paenibacillus foliorum]
MLTFILEIPIDKPISGVHCVPILDNGNLVMVWDREEQVLTTIGGRLEENESLVEALNREAMEEAGIELADEVIPFASWYWEEFDSYRVYVLTKVMRFIDMPKQYETTGYIITNFETAIDMIQKIEGREERIAIIRKAGILSGHLKE